MQKGRSDLKKTCLLVLSFWYREWDGVLISENDEQGFSVAKTLDGVFRRIFGPFCRCKKGLSWRSKPVALLRMLLFPSFGWLGLRHLWCCTDCRLLDDKCRNTFRAALGRRWLPTSINISLLTGLFATAKVLTSPTYAMRSDDRRIGHFGGNAWRQT